MKKEHAARWLTFAVLAGALGYVVWSKQGSPVVSEAPAADPQSVIYAMLDAAREGKPSDYLNAFTGQLQTSLRQAASEQGDARFAQYLKDQNAAIKGVALSDPQALTDTQTKVKVEYVYADRNEIQWATLEKTPQGWRIARIEAAERIKTLIPYGTPVN